MKKSIKWYVKAVYILFTQRGIQASAEAMPMPSPEPEIIHTPLIPTQTPAQTPEATPLPQVSETPTATPLPQTTQAPLTELDSEFISVPKKDNTPFNISVKKAGKDKLSISWSKRKSANKYNVWQKREGKDKWKLIKTTKNLTFKAKVKTGRYYKYKVTAIFEKKRVIGKTEVVAACIPDNVSNIIYKRTASNKVAISWKRGKCTKKYTKKQKMEFLRKLLL